MNWQVFCHELRSLRTRRSRLAVLLLAAGCGSCCLVTGLQLFPWLILLPLLVISTATDLSWRVIPNWLTFGGSLAALTAAGLGLRGAAGFLQAIEGLSVLFAITLFIHVLRGGMGAGDVKLAACLGACLGAEQGVTMLLITSVLAGMIPLLQLVLKNVCTLVVGVCMSWGWVWPWAVPAGTTFREVLMRRQPMAGWFAAGTLLSFSFGGVL
jgi:prepilin peptidase CpaA